MTNTQKLIEGAIKKWIKEENEEVYFSCFSNEDYSNINIDGYVNLIALCEKVAELSRQEAVVEQKAELLGSLDKLPVEVYAPYVQRGKYRNKVFTEFVRKEDIKQLLES